MGNIHDPSSPMSGAIPLENQQHEAFSLARASGLSQKAAALVAGYADKSAGVTGNRLEKANKPVMARLVFLRMNGKLTEETLDKARQSVIDSGGPDLVDMLTAKWLALEFFKNCRMARDQKNIRDANHSLVYIAKLFRKMDSTIPFPPGSPHPPELTPKDRIDADTDKTHTIQKGAEIASRMGGPAITFAETETDFEIVSPGDVEDTDGND